MSFFGGVRNSTTTSTQGPSADTQAYLDAYRKQAANFGQSGTPGSIDQYGQMAGNLAGNLNYGMQHGAQGVDQFFNPFQDQVIGGLQNDFQHQRNQADLAARDMATKQGAFGGSRSAVLQAQLQNGVNQNEANTLANVRQQGYNNSMQNLFQDRGNAINLGLSGFQGLMNHGQYQDQRQLQGLNAMLPGIQYGGTQSSQTTPYYDQGLFGSLLGAGASVAGAYFGGPGGAQAGQRVASGITGGGMPTAPAPGGGAPYQMQPFGQNGYQFGGYR